MIKYPQVNIESYAEGTPERVLAEYLLTWQREDWDRLHGFTQLTWWSKAGNPAHLLKEKHGFMKLQGVEINERRPAVGINPLIMQDIVVTVYYTVPSDSKKLRGTAKKKKILVRLICEIAPFQPSKDGKWGVNPVSALRVA